MKSDIWSLGILLYNLCALTPPFAANSMPELAQKIVFGKCSYLPPVFSNELTFLLSLLL